MLDHVVIVTDSASVDGGSAFVALSSARALAESGKRVTLFVAGGEPSADLASLANLRIVSTGQGDALAAKSRIGGALRGLWNARAYRMMREVLATLDPARTVVHVHGWTKALSSSVVAAVVHSRFPIVVTLHEYFTVCPTGCLYLHRDRKVCTLRPMSLACVTKDCDSRSYAFKVYRVARQLVQQAFAGIPARTRRFITVSSFSRQVLAPLLPSAARFYDVMNPVDATLTERVQAEGNQGVVYIGRLSAEKGGVLLAEAAKRANVAVTFVGDGPDRSAIERINSEAPVTGWLSTDAVTTKLRSARAIVVPSLWYETFGLVVMEAAALGVPAIVPTATAPADLVSDGATGMLFKRGDVDDLVAKLRLLEDAGTVERMSRTTYDAYWDRPPTLDKHVARLLAVYDEILTATPIGYAA